MLYCTSSGVVVNPVRLNKKVPGSAPDSDALGSVAVTVTVATTCTQAENSDVLPAGSVAVAVMNPEPVARNGSVASPFASVVTEPVAKYVCPSPLPDGSLATLV